MNEKKKKIAVIGLKGLPAFGGAARSSESVIDLLKHKYDYTVYATASHTDKAGLYNGYNQIVFGRIPLKAGNTLWYYILSALHCIFKGNYDLVHVHHVDAAFIIPLLRLRFTVIGTARGRSHKNNKWSLPARGFFVVMERLFLWSASVPITVSKYHQSIYKKYTWKKVRQISNGITVADLEFEADIDEKEDYILFAAGRIIPIKGCHTMLQAFQKLNYQGKILVIGDLEQMGRYKSNVLSLANGLNVRFIPIIKEKKLLMGYIKKAKLFIFPSELEAMSNMLLEAVSMKVPVVCSDIPENTAIFDEGEVLFFNTSDALDLAKKISDAISNPDKMIEYREKAFEKLETEYSWQFIANQYDLLYEECTSN